jgi:hypothetical protein
MATSEPYEDYLEAKTDANAASRGKQGEDFDIEVTKAASLEGEIEAVKEFQICLSRVDLNCYYRVRGYGSLYHGRRRGIE